MRRSLFGAVLGAFLVIAADRRAQASRSRRRVGPRDVANVPYQSASELITHVTAAEGGPLAVVVVDPRQRVMAVYHVDRATGEITLGASATSPGTCR